MLSVIDNTMAPKVAGASGGAQQNAPSIAAVAGKLNYCTGFDISGGGATAASIIEAALSGLAGGTINFELNILAGATGPMNAQGGFSVRFPDPIPASALNTAITLTVPSFGAGNTNASAVLYGFQK